ncbi:hypothetical protein Riv7116_4030 [Rivularia sp. PCC 7116]|uniref:hypothetical protein n=1 Tax=Rivularia sp. PCC 7116 TaxID=373994 RepID=UPI00029F36AC|nr:hypothetical protein [Rivularia sp. PCC 7116]AFY56470.1 hypothetical protein Riv7116_4030 [Rivularia sp. PCC 7116]
MTGQINDSLIYQGRDFSIVAVDGRELFNPQQYGITPGVGTTACGRGYYCSYEITDNSLQLKQLIVSIYSEPLDRIRIKHGKKEMQNLFGIVPSTKPNSISQIVSSHCATYNEVYAPIKFTGNLLIARDFIRSLYVHMGFQAAYKYKEVYELVFDKGFLNQSINRSEEMAIIRDKIILLSEKSDNWKLDINWKLVWKGKNRI